jgi:hypothetical protein
VLLSFFFFFFFFFFFLGVSGRPRSRSAVGHWRCPVPDHSRSEMLGTERGSGQERDAAGVERGAHPADRTVKRERGRVVQHKQLASGVAPLVNVNAKPLARLIGEDSGNLWGNRHKLGFASARRLLRTLVGPTSAFS